jgi:hypothetical protein
LVKKARTAEEQEIMDKRMAEVRRIRFENRAARKSAQEMEALTIDETKN